MFIICNSLVSQINIDILIHCYRLMRYTVHRKLYTLYTPHIVQWTSYTQFHCNTDMRMLTRVPNGACVSLLTIQVILMNTAYIVYCVSHGMHCTMYMYTCIVRILYPTMYIVQSLYATIA